ncbi:Nucleotidyl transferase AbiEii toxin, Type IV TA system [Candidatus Anstonella stagnisolia]|nr:Nucleotidyl transferase AbiEii toxin, Type IV TA system [Candidatus Anstonella stagnisolia]
MDNTFERKYKRVLEILPDVAQCAQGKLVLVGGTALALFHLKHRVSVDLDFVPLQGSDTKLKEELKGCLTKKGYHTTAGSFTNQFVVQFEDTSIKVEIFIPEHKIKRIEERDFGAAKIQVASLEDILQMKIAAYGDRKEARDLFDIFCILKSGSSDFGIMEKLISKSGMPQNSKDIELMALNPSDAAELRKMLSKELSKER